VTRLYSAEPCAVDRIDLLRSICRTHDNQTKEIRRGSSERRSGGKFTVMGCDANGRPLDPEHPWNKRK
jgi:5-methylcytosine-specific restriction protein A